MKPGNFGQVVSLKFTLKLKFLFYSVLVFFYGQIKFKASTWINKQLAIASATHFFMVR